MFLINAKMFASPCNGFVQLNQSRSSPCNCFLIGLLGREQMNIDVSREIKNGFDWSAYGCGDLDFCHNFIKYKIESYKV